MCGAWGWGALRGGQGDVTKCVGVSRVCMESSVSLGVGESVWRGLPGSTDISENWGVVRDVGFGPVRYVGLRGLGLWVGV